jgi:geranylgeranyl reductase family protein
VIDILREIYDVAVVGAGPAGSMAAKYASSLGARTLLLEEHKSLGWPVQCAGLLGKRAIQESELSPQSFTIWKVRGAKIYAPEGRALSFTADSDKAWVVDRRLFDRSLALEAVKCGADLRLSSQVRGAVIGEEGCVLTIGGESERWKAMAKVVISAEGVKARIAREAGIGQPKKTLSCAQIESSFRVDDPDNVELYLGNNLSPGLFGWVIPTGEDVARIGLCTELDAFSSLSRLLEKDVIRERVVGTPFDLVVGGLPLGPPERTVANGIVAVGDCAGQVKPTSGGGIYPGLLCAKIAGRVAASAALEGDSSLERLAEYETLWRRSIGRELELGMWINKILNSLTDRQLDDILSYIERKPRLIRTIEEHGDIDRPSLLFRRMILHIDLEGIAIARMIRKAYRESDVF